MCVGVGGDKEDVLNRFTTLVHLYFLTGISESDGHDLGAWRQASGKYHVSSEFLLLLLLLFFLLLSLRICTL